MTKRLFLMNKNMLKLSFTSAEITRFVLSLSMTVLLSGCATNTPSLGGDMDESKSFVEAYRIGPGDVLTIDVWRNPDVSVSVPVRPDGRISTPLVEDIVAADKTPTKLARDIEKVLSAYIKNPVVTIIIEGFGPMNKQNVRVIGAAKTAQSTPYKKNLTVLDVMIAVGGLTDFAAGNRSKIVRNVNGEQTEFRVRLDDLLKGADVSANVAMRPGDILIIPESLF